MSLRKRAQERANQTAKATKKTGLICQAIIESGIAPRLYEDWKHTDDCFVAYGDNAETEVRAKVMELVKRHTNRTSADVDASIAIRIMPGTVLSNSRLTGNTYVPIDPVGVNSDKRLSDFMFDHMSPEIEELEGKKVWVHVSWNRLPVEYGGDLSLQGKDARNEWVVIVTYLANKREAQNLANDLISGDVTMESLAVARGYDVSGMRKAQAQVMNQDGDKNEQSELITAIGVNTKACFTSLEFFTSPKTFDFIRDSVDKVDGDIAAAASELGADAGDFALLLNRPGFFKALMDETGLGEQEALAKVIKDTGVGNGGDVARLLNISEPPY